MGIERILKKDEIIFSDTHTMESWNNPLGIFLTVDKSKSPTEL